METITVETTIKAPIEKVWNYLNEPEHITKWAFGSNDWECTKAENDLREGGKFKTRMQAKDKSMGFDFEGTYTKVIPNKLIEYTMVGKDARKVSTQFEQVDGSVKVTQTFDREYENDVEKQRGGWQTILNNFKEHVENN